MNNKHNKKEKIFFWIGIFCLIGALVMISENIEAVIMYGVLAIVFIFLGRNALINYFQKLKSHETKSSLEANKTDALDSKENINFEFHVLAGLNVPENTNCIIELNNDKFNFVVNGVNFSLPINKITDISIKTDKEIQKQYVSSIGGAVAGAALFGSLGAMVRAEETN